LWWFRLAPENRFIDKMKQEEIDAAMATDPTTTELLMAGEGSLLLAVPCGSAGPRV
jgi:hypothetical protein